MRTAAALPQLLRFLRACVGGPTLAVVRPDRAVAEEIERWPAASGPAVVVVDDGAAVPPDARCVYLGPGVTWDTTIARALVLAAEAAAAPPAPGRTVLPLRLNPADRAPGAVLILDGAAPTPAAATAIAAIGEAGRVQPTADPIDPDLGALLFALSIARRSRHALDLGTGIGGAAIWLASAAETTGGRLTSIERDSARHTQAGRFLRQGGVSGAVQLRMGDAARWIGRLDGQFDLVFFDETPADRPDHLQALLPRLPRRALVVSRGGIGNAPALATFHAFLRCQPRLAAAVTLAVGDGVTLAVLN